MAKKAARNTFHPRLTACRWALGLPLGMMVAYAVLMMGFVVWSASGPPQWTVIWWGVTLVGLGLGVLCLYRRQRAARWGAVGVVLILGGVLTAFPLTAFTSQALQALGLVGLSLIFYDMEKVLGVPLMLPGGLLFLAVVATILNTPLMTFVGLALLAISGTLALGRM